MWPILVSSDVEVLDGDVDVLEGAMLRSITWKSERFCDVAERSLAGENAQSVEAEWFESPGAGVLNHV